MAVTIQVMPTKLGGLAPVRRIDSEVMKTIKPGAYQAKITKLRSRRAHNLYFKVIEIAAEHWPKRDEPYPQGDEGKLRAWLQCKAGPKWRQAIDGPADAVDFAIKIIEAMAGKGKYAFVDTVVMTDAGPKIRVHLPVSINYEEMGEEEFAPLRQAVFEQIELKFNCSIDELLAHGEAIA